jgi:hypothetical protein
LVEFDSRQIISFIMTIISIITLLQSFIALQSNPGSANPPFVTSIKMNNAIDKASHDYYDENKWLKQNRCDPIKDTLCLPLKLKMMQASFMMGDYNNVISIYYNLSNNNIVKGLKEAGWCSDCLGIEHINTEANVILAETYYNKGHIPYLNFSSIISDIRSRPMDDRGRYLSAISYLNDSNIAAVYDTLPYLYNIHKAVENISKSGDLFYFTKSANKVHSLESTIIMFVTNINYFIIGTLIASLIAFPVVVRHYTHGRPSQ